MEYRKIIARRNPPGDRWVLISDETILKNSLTEMLETIYQSEKVTQFFIDAKQGTISIPSDDPNEIPVPPKTDKFSLYGEF